ncbi:MAG: hypothetical protein DRQ46_07735 [Gammaproteobacteria bacterium]|nr:MAG: hypothetical protein DRQ46_07735 [Gammaproteobacteria bacterium]
MGDRRSTLSSSIKKGIDSALKELHTAMPGEIISFDPDEQIADIQPMIKRVMGGEVVNLPVLKAVPVRFMKSGEFTVTFPLSEGDEVELIFQERSIDTWLEQGGIVAPDDVRKHALSDAIAIPVGYSQANKISNFDPDNLEIRSEGGASIKITPDGNIELNGNADFVTAFDDMKAAFDQLVNDFDLHQHTITSGSSAGTTTPPLTPSTADMAGAKVETVMVS